MIEQFMAEACTTGSHEQVTAGMLYRAYKNWCQKKKLRGSIHMKFYMRLLERPDISKVWQGNTAIFKGIGLKRL